MSYRFLICDKCGHFAIDIKNNDVCPVCNNKKMVVNISAKEFIDMDVTQKENFARKQVGHEFDPDLKHKRIEYDTKLHQEIKESHKASKQVKCPKCNSTQIQLVNRKWSILTGFMTNKVDRVCMNCKHKF